MWEGHKWYGKKLELEQVKGDQEYQGDAFEIATVRVNVIRKLMFGQTLEESEGVSRVNIWEKIVWNVKRVQNFQKKVNFVFN